VKDTRKLIKELLEKGYLMSLGINDESGPWVADVIYVFDEDFNLYWLSEIITRHSQAILKNNKVAGTITISNKGGEANMGIQFEGIAEKVEGDVFEMAKQHRRKRGKPEPEKIGEIVEEGESWYKIKPIRIELIYEPLFGFDKRTLKLT